MKKIAILVAMGMEAAKLIARIEGAQPESAAGGKFLRGKIGQAEVVLHQCGWGMRNAEKGTRALIEHFQPDVIVNYGVSGGIVPEIGLAETVIALSSFPASGRKYVGSAAELTDEKLARFAAGLLPHAQLAKISTSLGIIFSKRRKTRVAQKSGAVCIDMETYTAAKTANELGVPLLVIRCLSDTYEPASLLSFFKNGAIAAEKAAADTEAVIKALAEA